MKFKTLYKGKCYILVVSLILFFSISLLLDCTNNNKKDENVVSQNPIEFKPPVFLPYEPAPVKENIIKYPDSLKYLGIEGEVILKLHINKQGEVTKAVVEKSLHPTLDTVAVREARTFKFSPGGVEPIACTLLFPVEFKLEDK